MANLNFDATNVQPADAFEPLPAGWYNAMIKESSMEATKNNDGQYLKLTLEVIDGQYRNRKIFTNLNLQNANPVAVEIAQKQLSAICHAIGVIQVQDSQQLHGLPLQVRLSIKSGQINPTTGQPYDPSNEVKGFKAVDGKGPAPVAAPGHAPTQAPSATPAAPPWASAAAQTTAAPAPTPVAAPVAPPVVQAPAAPPSYKEGDVVNGHRLTGGAWVPVPAAPPPAPPAPAAPPPPPGVPDAPAGSAVPPWARPAG